MLKHAAVCLAMIAIVALAACDKEMSVADNSDEVFDISFITNAFDIFPSSNGKAIDEIRDKFGANVTVEFIPNADYKSKLSVIMASGNYPDVIALDSVDSNFYRWARLGAFLPIDAYADSYPTLKAVPDYIWGQMKVDGRIYGIPTYAPTYRLSVLIRQDWLDNLGLPIPTNYDELLNAAIAFTKGDPDQNGKADTFGFNLGAPINPDFNLGAYWANGWYHKDKEGNYMPGWIGPGRKQLIQMLREAYSQGAVTQNFAAATNWQQTNKDFYSGRSGIFVGTPSGMNEEAVMGLLKAVPSARLAPVPYFVAPDGRQGGLNGPGYYGLTVLSSKLGGEPDKLKKILEIMDYGRTFIPMSERTPNNERFDWLFGHAGIGYDMIDGSPIVRPGSESITPYPYMLQRHEYWKPWAPNNEANEYTKTYKSPAMRQLAQKIEVMEKQSNIDPYDDPSHGIYSETMAQRGEELNKFLLNEQTKMIVGHRSVAEWDEMVGEWKRRGGDRIMKEINEGIQARLATR